MSSVSSCRLHTLDERAFYLKSCISKTELRLKEVEDRLKLEQQRYLRTMVADYSRQRETAEIQLQSDLREIDQLRSSVEDERRLKLEKEKVVKHFKSQQLSALSAEDLTVLEQIRSLREEFRSNQSELERLHKESEGVEEDAVLLNQKYIDIEKKMDAHYQEKLRHMDIYIHDLREK